MKRMGRSAFFAALLFVLAPAADLRAEEIAGTVHDVLEPTPEYARSRGGDLTLVLLTNGRVLRVRDAESLERVEEIERGMRAGRVLVIKFEEVDGADVIYEVSEAPADVAEDVLLEERGPRDDPTDPADDPVVGPTDDPWEGDPWEDDPWEEDEEPIDEDSGTTLSTSDLYEYMDDLRLRRSAQCFHRAYLWAYDSWRFKDASTRKVFLFFTQKYVREYNYKWWFHVAPYVNTGSGETVLDPTFTSRPLLMRTWTNVFIKDDHHCPTTNKYTGYGNHYRDRYCYLRKTSMYYYHPDRVQRADKGGYTITKWDSSGLKNSQVARP